MDKQSFLEAMSAQSTPAGSSGLWFVSKLTFTISVEANYRNKRLLLPSGNYTYLYRMTEGTMHESPPGEVVMEDTPLELQTHLPVVMEAHGRVLVTGLGLGCVVRGLLANKNVEHVTCIEKEKDVLNLVEPYMPKDRLTIIHDDALHWTKNNKARFDFAWHDLWSNSETGEPSLTTLHLQLMVQCSETVGVQGAWNFPREIKRLWKRRMKLKMLA